MDPLNVSGDVFAVFHRVRRRHVADLVAIPRADLAARHAERLEYFASEQRRIRRAAGRRGEFAGDDVQRVVVCITRAKTVGGFQILQTGDDILRRELIRRRPQHQVAAAFGQTAVMHEQIADLHVRRHPRIVHAERRQVFRDRIVPAQLALLHQPREQRRCHRLRVRRDLEQRVVIHRLAGGELADHVRVHDLAVLDESDGDAGQVIARDDGVDQAVVVVGFRRGMRSSCRCQQQRTDENFHALSQSCAGCSPAIISSNVCRRRTTA